MRPEERDRHLLVLRWLLNAQARHPRASWARLARLALQYGARDGVTRAEVAALHGQQVGWLLDDQAGPPLDPVVYPRSRGRGTHGT